METTKTPSLLNSAETEMQNINLKYNVVHPIDYHHHLTLAHFFSEQMIYFWSSGKCCQTNV